MRLSPGRELGKKMTSPTRNKCVDLRLIENDSFFSGESLSCILLGEQRGGEMREDISNLPAFGDNSHQGLSFLGSGRASILFRSRPQPGWCIPVMPWTGNRSPLSWDFEAHWWRSCLWRCGHAEGANRGRETPWDQHGKEPLPLRSEQWH